MAECDVRCSRCGRLFDMEERVACISGKVMGDEYTDCYYWCAACAVYTIRLYQDPFCGEDTWRDSAPLSKEEGDQKLELIRGCAEPNNERCKCAVHREYFWGGLD
jgi:hypothetical protein